MKVGLNKYFFAQIICLSLWPVLAWAQSPDVAANFEACKAGRETCDIARLSPSESKELALALHSRNVANCRNGYDSCDRSKLSKPEIIALAIADHQNNVSACADGMHTCDQSKLTPT